MYKELCSCKLLWILKENSEIVPSSCYIYIGSVFISLTSSFLDELENIAGLLIIKALEKKQLLKYLAFWSKHQPTWRKSKKVPTCCMLKYFRYNSFDVHSLFFHKRLKRLMCMAEATLLSLGEALDSTLDLIPQGKAGAGSVLQISDLLKLRCRMIYKSKRRMRGTIVCYLMNSVGLDTPFGDGGSWLEAIAMPPFLHSQGRSCVFSQYSWPLAYILHSWALCILRSPVSSRLGTSPSCNFSCNTHLVTTFSKIFSQSQKEK